MQIITENFAPKKIFEIKAGRAHPLPAEINWDQMQQSDALGTDIIYDESGEKPFGLGWIRFPPFGEVKLHTHEGSHILICFGGAGTLKVFPTVAGLLFLL